MSESYGIIGKIFSFWGDNDNDDSNHYSHGRVSWQNSRFWDVWSTRLLVAIGVIVLWDLWYYFNKPKREITDMSDGRGNTHSSSTARILNTPTIDVQKKKTRQSHPLLERLERQRGQSQELTENVKIETKGNHSQIISVEKEDKVTSEITNRDNQQTRTQIEKVKEAAESTPRGPTTNQGAKISNPNTSSANKSKSKGQKAAASSKAKSVSSPSDIPSTPVPRTMATKNTNVHPGMDGFGHWYEVETSLYRIYTLGRHDGVEVVPPYVPHSYRGQVPIHLHVTNETPVTLTVYWVDYKGKHVKKGTMRPNQVWTQTTWIDHPWVFEGPDPMDSHQSTPYLYYVPYRVLPSLDEARTTYDDDTSTGLYKFSLLPPSTIRNSNSSSIPHYIKVEDNVLPFPASQHFTTPTQAMSWTLQHMSRSIRSGHLSIDDIRLKIKLLQKYLANIMEHPDIVKYRQLRIRSSSPFGSIWNFNPLQGLLWAVGFIEHQGYAELGCAELPLSRDRIQDLALLSYRLKEWQEKEERYATTTNNLHHETTYPSTQPDGADGYGRAGFSRVGM